MSTNIVFEKVTSETSKSMTEAVDSWCMDIANGVRGLRNIYAFKDAPFLTQEHKVLINENIRILKQTLDTLKDF